MQWARSRFQQNHASHMRMSTEISATRRIVSTFTTVRSGSEG